MSNVRTLQDLYESGGGGGSVASRPAPRRVDPKKSSSTPRIPEDPVPASSRAQPRAQPRPPTPLDEDLVRHPARAILTELGMRNFVDAALPALQKKLRGVVFPDLVYGDDDDDDEDGDGENFNADDEVGGSKNQRSVLRQRASTDASSVSTSGSHRSWSSSAVLSDIRADFDVEDSYVAVGEDHILWRIRGSVKAAAAYRYRWKCFSDDGRLDLSVDNVSLTLKLVVEAPSSSDAAAAAAAAAEEDEDLLVKVITSSSPSSSGCHSTAREPLVQMRRFSLKATSRGGNAFDRFATRVATAVLRRRLRRWFAEDAGAYLAELVNGSAWGFPRCVEGEMWTSPSSSSGCWRLDVRVVERLGYRIGGGAVFGCDVALRLDDVDVGDNNAVASGRDLSTPSIDEALALRASTFGVSNDFVLLLPESLVNGIFSASPESNELRRHLMSKIESRATDVVASLEIDEERPGCNPRIEASFSSSPRLRLTRSSGVVVDAAVVVEIRARAPSDAARYPGDGVYVRVHYEWQAAGSVELEGGDGGAGGGNDPRLSLTMTLESFKGNACVESCRFPGVKPSTPEFLEARSRVSEAFEALGDAVFGELRSGCDAKMRLATLPPSCVSNEFVEATPKVRIVDGFVVVFVQLAFKENFGQSLADALAAAAAAAGITMAGKGEKIGEGEGEADGEVSGEKSGEKRGKIDGNAGEIELRVGEQ